MIEYQFVNTYFIFNKKFHSSWIRSVFHEESFLEGQIAYIFCTDAYLLEINQKFLQHDTYTDIVTFPLGDIHSKIISGEIYISIERIMENAAKFSTPFETELNRVLIHGILHLMGYEDHTDEEKRQMRAKEDYYLSLLPQN